MEPSLYSALSLLVVGMITVFAVLSLVVFTGNLLIRVVNAYTAEQIPIPATSKIEPKKLAAITAAVEVVTKGEGQITKVEKI
jgi:oxaloacetate decarboxylase gamma subunit